MRQEINRIGYRLEALELAKLRDEYENKNFTFNENKKKKFGNKILILDGYAYNPKTGEEIIFEVKAVNNISSEQKSIIWDQLKLYREYLPKAKIILVTPKEVTRPSITIHFTKVILFNEIFRNHHNELTETLRSESIQVIQVIKEEYETIEIDNSTFKFIGHAHLVVLVGNEPNLTNYEIPFNFWILGKNNIVKFPEVEMDFNTKIKFDFFEYLY